jgi:hypothetical protein
MSQKNTIFDLLDQGKTREEIEEETNFAKVTVGYYHRMWVRGSAETTNKIEIEEDYINVSAPHPDDFDEQIARYLAEKKDKPQPTPETVKDNPKGDKNPPPQVPVKSEFEMAHKEVKVNRSANLVLEKGRING